MLRRVLAEVPQRLLEEVGIRLHREVVGRLDVDRDAVVRPQLGRDLAQQRGDSDGLDARRLGPRVGAREREHRPREARETPRLALDVGEEAVALDGILLRAGLQDLDRADDRRQRRAQLVRGVRDELALGELAPLLLGEVVDDEQRPVGVGLGRDADDAVRVVLVGRHVHVGGRRALLEERLRELAEAEAGPRLGQRVSLREPSAEQPPRLGVRVVDDEILVDREHSLVQALEQQLQSVALGLEAPERAAELAPHPVEALREQAELVAEAVVQRRLEVAARDRLRRDGQPPQPQRDQLREEEADDDADHAGDHACAERLAVDGVDRFGDVGEPRDRDERRAAVRDARDVDAAVRGSAAELLARKRGRHGVALELRRACVGGGGRRGTSASSGSGGAFAARCAVLQRDLLAVAAKRVLRAVGELRDDDRGRRRGHDRERNPEPPAHADERPEHSRIVGFPACRKATRSIAPRRGSRFSSDRRSRSRRRIRARR